MDSCQLCGHGVQLFLESEDIFLIQGPSTGVCYNRSLAEMREEEELCDVTIKAGTRSFHAHRAILAAASPVFRAMFKNDFAESRKKEITLDCIEPQSLEDLINFIYWNRLKTRNTNVLSLLETAMYLIITPVINACFELLSKTINHDNVLAVHHYAQIANKADILEDAYRYVLQNFQDVYKCEGFAALSVDTLKNIIRRDDQLVTSTEVLYKAVNRWVQASEEDRMIFLPELLEYIRMPSLSSGSLKSGASKEELILKSGASKEELIPQTSPVCYGTSAGIHKHKRISPLRKLGLFNDLPIRDIFCKKSIWSSRNLDKLHGGYVGLPGSDLYDGCYLYAVCTESDSTSLSCINYYDFVSQKWIMLCNNLHIDLRWLWHVVCTTESLYFIQMNNSFKLNLKTLGITNLKYNAKLVSATGILYHCGGVYLFGGFDNMANKVYFFDLLHCTYKEIGSLVVERRYTTAAFSENSFFVFGGVHPSGSRLQSVEKFCPKTSQSTEVSPMLRSRSGCNCAVLKGKIYVCGGELKTDFNQSVSWSVEVYDPLADQWSLVREMNRTHDVYLIPYNGKLRALCKGTATKNMQSETYDPETDEWKFDKPRFSDQEGFFKVAVLRNSAIRFTDFDPCDNTPRRKSSDSVSCNSEDFSWFLNSDEDL